MNLMALFDNRQSYLLQITLPQLELSSQTLSVPLQSRVVSLFLWDHPVVGDDIN